MPSSAVSNSKDKRPIYFNKLNLLWLVFTVLVFSVLVKLGLWQSARALEKEQRLLQIEKLSTQNPITIDQLLKLSNTSGSFTNINDVPVVINGKFNNQQVFLLDNQVNKGRLGYRVYQVAQMLEHSILVSLGWIQGSKNRDEIPSVAGLNGQHKFQGNIRLIEKGIVLQEQMFTEVNWPLRVQQIELDKFSAIINQKLLPFVVYLDKNEVIGFEKNWQPIVMPPEKHRAYAFQWFSLAAAWLLLMLWAKFGTDKSHNKNKSRAA